jgi:hypothetical protein
VQYIETFIEKKHLRQRLFTDFNAGDCSSDYASHYSQIQVAHRLLQQNADLLFCKDLLGKTSLDVSKNTETSVALLLAYHEYTRQPTATLFVSDLYNALTIDGKTDIEGVVPAMAEPVLKEHHERQRTIKRLRMLRSMNASIKLNKNNPATYKLFVTRCIINNHLRILTVSRFLSRFLRTCYDTAKRPISGGTEPFTRTHA